ncbi:MAG: 2-dehydropantoate 2-reductase [Psychromonas sp.]
MSIKTKTNLRIAIMGAGAMGSVLGALLHRSGAQVWLVDGWQEHVNVMNDKGLTLTGEIKDTVKLNATTDASSVGIVDLVIFQGKSNQLPNQAKVAQVMVDENTLLLALQNGIGHAETLSAVYPAAQIMFGFCEYGADLLGPGQVSPHLGKAIIAFQPASGVFTEAHQRIVQALSDAGFTANLSLDVEKETWEKLVMNGCFNASCALTRLKAGHFYEQQEAKALVADMLDEIIAVAAAKEIMLDAKMLTEKLSFVVQVAGDHHPSLAQDVMNKRMTEILSINGAIVHEGDRLNVPVPVNRTITRLVSILHATYEKQF